MGEGLNNIELVDGAKGEPLLLAQYSDKSIADILRESTGDPKQDDQPKDDGDAQTTTPDKVEEKDKPATGEAQSQKEFKSVVEIDFNDMHRNNLKAPFYEAVRVKGMPEGVVPSHWVDDNGHYFYFKSRSRTKPNRQRQPLGAR